MSLKEYNKKRTFSSTPEPKGTKTKGSTFPSFVIHKHAATRLHYDFRIEIDGVLVSWAIPKQPVLDPTVKRLAIQTEDHPLSYGNFEGVIPEGNYGAGTVMIWDMGTFASPHTTDLKKVNAEMKKGIKKGHVEVVLLGEKLKGLFHLIKLKKGKKDEWLFFKGKDEYTKKRMGTLDYSVKTKRSMKQIERNQKFEKRNSKKLFEDLGITEAVKNDPLNKVTPMTAILHDQPFNDNDVLFEIKLDGYRTLAHSIKKRVKLISRNNLSVSKKYPEIVDSFKSITDNIILDGEIVVVDNQGRSRFELIQNWSRDKNGTLHFYVFDILYYDGYDLRQVPLYKRKKLLKHILHEDDVVKYLDHIVGKGKTFFKEVVKRDFEGVIAKHKESVYHVGKRSKEWLKIKNIQQTEAIICGYTKPEGKRKHFGSLALGMFIDDSLTYIGNMGTGFGEQEAKELLKKFKSLKRKTSPFPDKPEMKQDTQWISPKLVCQVKFTEWTEDQKLRQAVYLGLRDDKKPKEVILPVTPSKPSTPLKTTNLDKVFWPKEGYTKGDVIEYYKSISKYILPYLKDRPQNLHRTPDGVTDPGFYQKDVAGKVPPWIETIILHSDSAERDIEYMLCQNRKTLQFIANWGSVEIHTWNSRIQSLDYPDYAVFDLDPFDISFDAVIEVALETNRLLSESDVPCYIKTSGGSGLHIYIPTKAKYTYDQVRDFVKLVQILVHKRLPKITSFERMPQKRKGKVYLDYLQNTRGKTMIAPYSLRPKPKAPVSTPLEWKEVRKGIRPTDFTLKTIHKRLKKKGDLWKGILRKGFEMRKALNNLEKIKSYDHQANPINP